MDHQNKRQEINECGPGKKCEEGEREKERGGAKGSEWRRWDRTLCLPCVRLFLANCASLADYTHCHHGNKCLAVWLPVMYNECGGVFVRM